MKKLLFTLLLLSTASILADQPLVLSPRRVQGTGPITIDGLVYSQTYDFGHIIGGAPISGILDRWLCDDFELDNDYYISDVYVWMIWTGEQASLMNLVISEDDTGDSDPNTNIDVWAETVPCSHTDTGDNIWGYDIYETHCVINADVYPELDSGKHYYFEVQADVSDSCFILFSVYFIGDYCWFDDGSGVWVRSDYMFGMYSDMFFDFYGEPVSALEPETWGSIKTLF